MRVWSVMLVSAALLATACKAEKSPVAAENRPEVAAATVAAPKDGDWSKIVTKTADGGFLMGNPDAKVKLVEFGSLTCHYCADFEEQGGKPLVDNYVKKGRVSWEFRNYVRDQFDMAATLLARCGGEASFFGLTRKMFADQRDWIARIQAADPAKAKVLETTPPAQRFSAIADLAGLKQYVTMRGVPRARAEQCLTNEAEINQLVQMNSDASSAYGITGTPSFVINGASPAFTGTWETVEPKLKEALGG
jgi:protein-disulfide isomerase